MWDDEITLLKRKEAGVDELKQPVFTEEETKILATIRSVTRSEFYQAQASQGDLRPSRVAIIHGYEYDGQEFALIAGKRYKIIKTYSVDFEQLELTLEEVL